MSHTKSLINRRFPRFSVKSPNIGGDLVGVDVSFRSFLCAKENGHKSHIGGGLGGGGCLFASFSVPEKVRNEVVFASFCARK